MSTFPATSGDGYVRNTGTSSWATLRSAGSGTAAFPSGSGVNVYADSLSDFTNRYIDRGFIAFDTSSIGSGTTISSASLWIYVLSHAADAGGSFAIVSGTQASTSTLATSDFSAVGSTEFCTRVGFGLTDNAWKEVVLNASGIAAINKTGTTKFALRSSFDLDNSEPTSFTYSSVFFASQDNATPGFRPYLSVVVPGAPAPFRRRPSGLYTR